MPVSTTSECSWCLPILSCPTLFSCFRLSWFFLYLILFPLIHLYSLCELSSESGRKPPNSFCYISDRLSLLTTSRQKNNFIRILPTEMYMYLQTRKNWLKFGNHPPLNPDTIIFERILQHCTIGHFVHISVDISGESLPNGQGTSFIKIPPLSKEILRHAKKNWPCCDLDL